MTDEFQPLTRKRSEASNHHDLGDVWQEIRKHGETVARLHIENRSLADSLADIRNEVRSELREIRTIISRPQQPINWIGIGSLAVAILIAGGTYANSVLAPVNQKTDQNWHWIQNRSEKMLEESKQSGITAREATFAVEHILEADQRLEDLKQRVARLEGIEETDRKLN